MANILDDYYFIIESYIGTARLSSARFSPPLATITFISRGVQLPPYRAIGQDGHATARRHDDARDCRDSAAGHSRA